MIKKNLLHRDSINKILKSLISHMLDFRFSRDEVELTFSILLKVEFISSNFK